MEKITNKHLAFAKSVAEDAAKIALNNFGFKTRRHWKKDNTPVTVADKKINDLVIKRVHSVFPTHGVVGEERSSHKRGSKYAWVCDPIDGTMPFSCGLPMFTFSLALVDQTDGQPVLGLVNDPVMGNMYWAVKGKGAYRNGARIGVSKDGGLDKTYMNLDGSGWDFGFSSSRTIDALRKRGVKVMKLLSFIYGAIQVANGKFSGAIFFNRYGHDVAALKVIVEEAGGKVTDLRGMERRYDGDGFGAVISNGLIHGEVIRNIKKDN